MNRPNNQRVLLFGISGATWDVMSPLIAAGRLPTISRLVNEGTHAVLKSLRVTGDKHIRPQPTWPSIATGCVPARHGIERFYHTADDLRVPPMWDWLGAKGKRIGLFSWPISWPVRPVNGFCIPGYDGRDAATHPAELTYIRTLDRRQTAARAGKDILGRLGAAEPFLLPWKMLRAGTSPATLGRLAAEAVKMRLAAPKEIRPLLMRRARLRVSSDIFCRLCRKMQIDFGAFVTFLVDYASHRFWLYRQPSLFPDAPADVPAAMRSAVDEAYVAVDRTLGHMLRRLGPEMIVAVVSEHGMSPEIVSAEIGPHHYALRPNRLRELLQIPPTVTAVPIARWLAYQTPSDLQAGIATRFEQVTVQSTGQPLFQVALHRNEVIVKLALPREQYSDLQDLDALNIVVDGKVHPFTEIAQRFGARRSAMHAENGVLILHGPGIRRGEQLSRASIVDVAPTLSRAMGVAHPEGLDGVMLDAFA